MASRKFKNILKEILNEILNDTLNDTNYLINHHDQSIT